MSTATNSVMEEDVAVSDSLVIANAFNATVNSDLAKQFTNQAGPLLVQTSSFEPF